MVRCSATLCGLSPFLHFKTSLLIRFIVAGVVSAPLWNSKTSQFAGLLTSQDFINVIQYYWQFPSSLTEIDNFRLSSLRDVERAINVPPPETINISPLKPLYDACVLMSNSHARRIPLIDEDDDTGNQMVVSVLTQFRILRFVAVNVKETQMLRKPLHEIGVGTYEGLETATMSTPVIDVIHRLVNKKISAVPILDDQGMAPPSRSLDPN
jgi:5'-AMP-activated protein kinase, regulatory gamma subunit